MCIFLYQLGEFKIQLLCILVQIIPSLLCYMILITVPGETFPYEQFFHEQIMRKKKDHSYRVFKKVNRLAAEFPGAYEYSWGERPITVWCSNDYLGMSCHPKVKEAVR